MIELELIEVGDELFDEDWGGIARGVRISVSTSPFHGERTGSTPVLLMNDDERLTAL